MNSFKNYKILMLTEGGARKGLGHVARCEALYSRFLEAGAKVNMFVSGDSSAAAFLKTKRYKLIDWILLQKSMFNAMFEADAIIIDSYTAPESLYFELSRKTNARILMIDDYNRINYPPGVVLNPSLCGKRLDYARSAEKEYLTGKEYILLREEFLSPPPKEIRKELKNVLVSFGGSDKSRLSSLVSDFLRERGGLKVHVVDSQKNVLPVGDLLDLMLWADVCLTGGGQTLYELARVGVPAIGICLAENQKLNLEAMEEEGIADYIGWQYDDDLLEKIDASLIENADAGIRKKRSDAGRKLVDGKGPERVASFLESRWK